MGRVRSVDVGGSLRLVPYWERGLTKSDRIELIIDPGPSFGAGDHPTTLMALELLEVAISMAEEIGPPPTMLDVGTGTGVLAIAGKMLGTGFTVGLDVDPAAVFIARRNVALNRGCDPARQRSALPFKWSWAVRSPSREFSILLRRTWPLQRC